MNLNFVTIRDLQYAYSASLYCLLTSPWCHFILQHSKHNKDSVLFPGSVELTYQDPQKNLKISHMTKKTDTPTPERPLRPLHPSSSCPSTPRKAIGSPVDTGSKIVL